MAEYVRVTDPDTKAHVTVTAQRAKSLGLTPLKETAVDGRGRPLAATYPTTSKTTAVKAEDKK